jgi:hypothetical protein
MTNSSDIREELNIPKMRNYSKDVFHKNFENQVTMTSKELIAYREPTAAPSSKSLKFVQIDGDNADDFSGDNISGVHFTDYMKAHTANKLGDASMFNESTKSMGRI